MKQWYEALFENSAEKYDREVFVTGTTGECDFIEKEAAHDKSLRILDIGCGTGRHCIELASRGYNVLGVDLSESQLQRAREKAAERNLNIPFLQHDARNMPFDKAFDLAIMMCEGGFPLMETDEMNYDILLNASKALKSPGKLIFTTLNGLFPVFNSIDQFHENTHEEGNAMYKSTGFNLMTFRDHNITTAEDDQGKKIELVCNERYYIPPEIIWLLKTAGFAKVEIYGARLGEFSRSHPLTIKDFEMLVIAEK